MYGDIKNSTTYQCTYVCTAVSMYKHILGRYTICQLIILENNMNENRNESFRNSILVLFIINTLL